MAVQTKREVASWIASAEVLPCPFCGKRPVFHPKEPAVEGNAWAVVRCETKSCSTFHRTAGHGVAVSDNACVADERGTTGYMLAAMKRWNLRY